VSPGITVDTRRCCVIAAFALLCLPGIGAGAAPQPTAADEEAAREELLARPQVDFIHDLRDQEMSRLLNDEARPASAYVAKLVDGNWSNPPRLGDVGTPLHLRLIELARLDLVSGIEAARQAVPQGEECNVRNAFGRALFEPEGRLRALAMIYCARAGGERARKAIDAANRLHERRILELRLPPYTRDQWLAAARAATAVEDERLRRTYDHRRDIDEALEKWILFLDDHAHAYHVDNGSLVFDSDEDAATARGLQADLSKLLDAEP
jgi:hypothetical protein